MIKAHSQSITVVASVMVAKTFGIFCSDLGHTVTKFHGQRCEMQAGEVWLFGSRARGDHRPDSDYDLLAVVPDNATEGVDTPMAAFELRRRSKAHADLLTGRMSDFIGPG